MWCHLSLRSYRDAAKLTYPKPLPIGPQHSLVDRPWATSSWQGICRCLVLEIFKLLRDLLNLEMESFGRDFTVEQSLLHRVCFPNLAIDHILTFLHCLQLCDCFYSQLPTNFLKFVQLSMTLLLVWSFFQNISWVIEHTEFISTTLN